MISERKRNGHWIMISIWGGFKGGRPGAGATAPRVHGGHYNKNKIKTEAKVTLNNWIISGGAGGRGSLKKKAQNWIISGGSEPL